EEERPVRVSFEEAPELVGGLGTGSLAALSGIADRADLGYPLVDLPVRQCQEELLLAREVRVDGAGREARFGGDLLEARLLVAPPRKHTRCSLEQSLAGLLLLLASGQYVSHLT